jgi:hypothetical protein
MEANTLRKLLKESGSAAEIHLGKMSEVVSTETVGNIQG